ncbi:T9SS type B sorting domain-containing protein [Filimonas lacunae]|nr:gliding motility-associated C-terminal domain-containing protein [Filimonas lacunae]
MLFRCVPAQAQCATGQTPSTAFPICGYDTFHMATVPACSGRNLPVPTCAGDGAAYGDLNAFWYKFTCYTAGTLGFLIDPVEATDDYDWQLYDITGANPDDVYTNPALIVTGNWAGTYDKTGASATGVTHIECASIPSDNRPTFSSMPTLIQGHIYLLMISHFTVTNQSGYSLSFGGGTAGITDPLLPHLANGEYYCNTQTVRLKLNKKVKCSSLATDGSDFTLNTPGINIVSATGIGCNNGFDLDSIVLTLNQRLPPGNYSLVIQNGSDANTLLDYCDRDIPAGEHVDFSVSAPALVYIDSIKPLPCAPDSLQIVFTQPIDCATIAADGSDFTITGPMPVGIIGAKGSCTSNNTDNTITLYFDKRLTTAGTYTVVIGTGTDGNGISSQCGQYILAGDNTRSFIIPPQPVSLLKRVTPVTCRVQKIRVALTRKVQCGSVATNGSDFTITGPTTITITRAESICSNNLTDSIDLYFNAPVLTAGAYQVNVQTGTDGNTLLTECWQETPVGNTIRFATSDTVNANFTYQLFLHCTIDSVVLSHNGANGVNQWNWYYDGNDSSKLQNPVKVYKVFGTKNIKLVVSNGVCSDSSTRQVVLTNVLKAAFSIQPDTLCPNDQALYINESYGNIIRYEWTFGNGNISAQHTPPGQTYAVPTVREQLYYVKLVVQSEVNCYDTVIHPIHVLNSCYIAVPTGFTPNNDGLNDYLYPLNGFTTSQMDFKVFNRLGQMVFHTTRPDGKWNGVFNGEAQPPGAYVWMFSYTEAKSGKHFFLKGTSVLIR